MALPLPAQEPARIDVTGSTLQPKVELSANQKLANTIADHLRQGGQLHQYKIDVAVENGAAKLSGTVSDQTQREEALRLVQGIPGVERVVNQIGLAGAITAVQGLAQAPESAPQPRRVPGGAQVMMNDPAPIFQAPAPGPYDLNEPKMPNYAWPTYAPYNNFSRVATPEAYPYQSWPYIGPCYPFPKIPPGWRSVKLEWQDSHWWYSKVATKHDWWRIRYW